MPVSGTVLYAVYVGAFGLAALGTFASLPRLSRISDPDTRRGLRALVLLSGGWATSIVGFLLVGSTVAKLSLYVAGLVLGLGTVGAWLYVTSAYTNRSYHRDRTYRRLAVAVFVVLVAIKVTNPLHHGYFSVSALALPFPHLSLSMGPLHWTAMGLSYALAFVGYFMLVEQFRGVDLETRPLVALLVVTALPVGLDVIGYASPALLDVTYEPLGVAVFAVGVAFVYVERFDAVQLASETPSPTITLDADGRIKDSNAAARRLFPQLDPGVAGPLDELLPTLAEGLSAETPVIELPRGADSRYYHITRASYTTGNRRLGSTVVLTDVTEREQYRRELERQNERLDRFAGLVSHDLRNPLTVATGRLELLRDRLPEGDADAETIADALSRMGTMIEDILTMARHGQPVTDGEPVTLSEIVPECWAMVETTDAELEIDGDLTFPADPKRLRLFFENLMRNAIDHGGPRTTVTVGTLPDGTGFYVEDDGPGIPETDRERVFEAGYSTDSTGTGFGLAIVADIAAAHRWQITITAGRDGGARFEVTGVDLAESGGGTGS